MSFSNIESIFFFHLIVVVVVVVVVDEWRRLRLEDGLAARWHWGLRIVLNPQQPRRRSRSGGFQRCLLFVSEVMAPIQVGGVGGGREGGDDAGVDPSSSPVGNWSRY